MVRTYIRKTQKGAGFAYTNEDLQRAIEDVKNGNKTTRGAALFYNIPRSTLKNYVLGTRGKGCTSQEGRGGGGVVSYLSAVEEEEIANCIRVMEKNGFGLSREELLDLVQAYIRQNKLQTRFKDQRPGTDWFIAFRKRHRLSIKKPQSIEHVRCDQINPWVIYDFFDKLTEIIRELKLEGKPSRIFNCDETSFCHDPSKTKIVGAIGVQSQRKTSSSGRENTTALLCCSADGRMLPLLCVFKGKYVMENWVDKDTATQTAVAATERGWMETTLFYNWFKDLFLKNIGEERPVLLIYDGHVTHISTNLIRLAQEKEVTIMKLPPHTTHLLQPLDVAVFRSLKSKWDKELCKWQRENPRKKIPKPEFINILTNVTQEISAHNIINGFKTTGIFDSEMGVPNKDAISVSVFKSGDLQRYKKTLSQNDPPLQLREDLTESAAIKDQENVAITSSAIKEQQNVATMSTAIVVKQNVVIASTSVSMQEDIPTAKEYHPEIELTNRKSFEDVLLNLLQKEPKHQKEIKRKRIVTNCEIITTSEYLKKKEEDEKQKEETLQRKKLKLSTKLRDMGRNKHNKKNCEKINDVSSEESDTYSLQESDNDLNFSATEDEDEMQSLQQGDYCVVKVFGKTANSFRLYVVKILEKLIRGYEIVFFKRHCETTKFIETSEHSFIRETDIVRKLSKPITSSSARYNNMISFSTDITDVTNI